ncbi:MAG: VOC family protein [Anaerolineae bacterium]|jgi:uncharacterized glyoxalase superfamily protein PhnB|nr:VOC family protein [Anaerolineae bacterium]
MEIGIQVYVRGSDEAVQVYQQAFGVALGYHVRHSDGTFLHAELERDGKSFLAVSEADNDIGEELRKLCTPERYPPMNFGITLPDAEAVHQAFAVLSQGGVVLMPVTRLPWSDCCANVVDRFGVFWYVSVPNHRPEDDELTLH